MGRSAPISDELKKEIQEIVVSAVADATKGLVEAAKQPATANVAGLSSAVEGERIEAGGEKPDGRKGMNFARSVRVLALASLRRANPFDVAKSLAKQESGYEAVAKAMGASNLADGGAFVPTVFSSEWIELLRNQAIVRKMGARMIENPTGSMVIGRLDTGATAYYVGESVAPIVSAPKTGQLQAVARKLMALVPVGNDLLRRATPSVDEMLRDDLLQAAAEREDKAFIIGEGVSNEPKGILNWTASGNKFNANGTTNLANTLADLHKARRLIKDALIPFINPGWMFSYRTEEYLLQLRDGVGGFVFRPEMTEKGTLLGIPYGTTGQIVDNGGGGSDESRVYLVCFGHVIVADTLKAQVDAQDGVAYDQSGTVKAAYSLDETVIRLISEHDLLQRYMKAATIIEQVKWA